MKKQQFQVEKQDELLEAGTVFYDAICFIEKGYPSVKYCAVRHSRVPSFPRNPLLEGNETGRVGGTDTGATVADGLAVVAVSMLLECIS
jgi:hypothetical protein